MTHAAGPHQPTFPQPYGSQAVTPRRAADPQPAGKLRVGLVCPYSYLTAGGVQTHVLGLAGWLLAQGHDVRILAPGQPAGEVFDRHRVPASVYTSTGGSLPVPYNSSVARISFGALTARRVARWFAASDLDVVHVHEPVSPSVGMLAVVESPVAVLGTFHSAAPGAWGLRWAGRHFRRTLSGLDAAVSVSWVAHDIAQRHLGVESRVIGNGIRLADHPLLPTTTRWRGGDRPRITFIGRYSEPRKGLQVLLDALPAIRAVHPDVEVAIVGQGGSVLDAGVTLMGALSDAARDDLLSRTDVYVAPNLGRESFGIILLEALASGAPVVASDLTAFRSVVTDDAGAAARLFPVGDHRALAEEVVASLAEPRDLHLARSRAVAGRFDWNSVGPELVEEMHRARAIHARRHTPEP